MIRMQLLHPLPWFSGWERCSYFANQSYQVKYDEFQIVLLFFRKELSLVLDILRQLSLAH